MKAAKGTQRGPTTRGPSVSVQSRGGPHGIASSTLRAKARRMLKSLGRDDAELTVTLVDDETMRELNAQWRGKDTSTDVLSFAMTEGEYGDINPQLLGDVVISVPTALRQARDGRRELMDEVTMLLAHGLLHLLGYDHQTRAALKDMTHRTEQLVQAAAGSRSARVVRAHQ